MSKITQYLRFISQVIDLQIEDYQNGLGFDIESINKMLERLKVIIVEEVK